MDIYKKIGQRLKHVKLQNNLTYAKLDENSDVSLDQIKKFIGGTRRVKLDTLKKIADALDVPTASLFPLHWLFRSRDIAESEEEIYLSSEVDVKQLLQILKDQGWIEYKK